MPTLIGSMPGHSADRDTTSERRGASRSLPLRPDGLPDRWCAVAWANQGWISNYSNKPWPILLFCTGIPLSPRSDNEPFGAIEPRVSATPTLYRWRGWRDLDRGSFDSCRSCRISLVETRLRLHSRTPAQAWFLGLRVLADDTHGQVEYQGSPSVSTRTRRLRIIEVLC